MVTFFEKYPQLLSGKIDSTFNKEKRKKKKWEDLMDILNAEGTGPSKTADMWRKGSI
ncbi:hypothetical protein X975_10698, partial [Stegodyphus mimosarum]